AGRARAGPPPERRRHGRPAERAERVEATEGGDAVAVAVAGQREIVPRAVSERGTSGASGAWLWWTYQVAGAWPNCPSGSKTATEARAAVRPGGVTAPGVVLLRLEGFVAPPPACFPISPIGCAPVFTRLSFACYKAKRCFSRSVSRKNRRTDTESPWPFLVG